MKPDAFATVLRDFAALMATGEAAYDADTLGELSKIFSRAKAASTATVLKKLGSFTFTQSDEGNLAATIPALKAAHRFAATHMKKTVSDDLARLLDFCKSNPKVSLASLASEIQTAIDAKPAKKATAKKSIASQAEIDHYVRRLDETFGFEPDFDNVFNALKADPKMKAAQLKKIAKLFAHASTKSAADALKAIYKRHQNIMSAEQHRKSMAGRIAG